MSRRRFDLDPLSLDGNTAERILSGSVPPADAPPRYAGVARVLQAATRPPDPAELAGEVEAVALIVSALQARPAPADVLPRRRRGGRATGRLVAALGCAGGLTLTSGLAAAGALPGFAQDAAATVLHRVGVDVPSSHHHAPAVADAGAADQTSGTPADAARADGNDERPRSPEKRTSGRQPAPGSAPAPAAGERHGAEVADEAQDAEPGPGHGDAVCDVASDDRCRAGDRRASDRQGSDPRGDDGDDGWVRGSGTNRRSPGAETTRPDDPDAEADGGRRAGADGDSREGGENVDRDEAQVDEDADNGGDDDGPKGERSEKERRAEPRDAPSGDDSPRPRERSRD